MPLFVKMKEKSQSVPVISLYFILLFERSGILTQHKVGQSTDDSKIDSLVNVVCSSILVLVGALFWSCGYIILMLLYANLIFFF